jgi:hypothetical protein
MENIMKKLLFTLGLLMYGGAVYGMNPQETSFQAEWRQAVVEADWEKIAEFLKSSNNRGAYSFIGIDEARQTTPAKLSAKGKNDSYLLPVLIYNLNDTGFCEPYLLALIRNGKIDLTATDGRGNLLCNDPMLTNGHKQRFATLLADNNIPNPFTQVSAPYGIMLFKLKPKPGFTFTALKNYKLWAATGLVLAAVGIYTWYARKKKAADNKRQKDTETDEKLEEAHEQVTA